MNCAQVTDLRFLNHANIFENQILWAFDALQHGSHLQKLAKDESGLMVEKKLFFFFFLFWLYCVNLFYLAFDAL